MDGKDNNVPSRITCFLWKNGQVYMRQINSPLQTPDVVRISITYILNLEFVKLNYTFFLNHYVPDTTSDIFNVLSLNLYNSIKCYLSCFTYGTDLLKEVK